MELDDFLSQLNDDLQDRIDEVDRSLEATFGNPGRAISFCPECGSPLDAEVNFCPNCGADLRGRADACSSSGENTDANSVGILFTDTRLLAEKYNITIEHVREVFDAIISQASEYGIEWYLLDASDYILDDLWMDYNDAISGFMEEHDIPYGIHTSVFIIGGNDVIPIPIVEDPFGSSYGTAYSGRIPCDMCYAFHGPFFSDIWDGDRSITEESVRNTVSRLPLEDGPMGSSIYDDIVSYFERCCEFYRNGIQVNGVMMTANVSWLPASKTMSEHLPLVVNSTDEDMVFSDMYVCPPVDPKDDHCIEPVRKTLKNVDMLLFNLHGTDRRRMSGFYSDEGEAFNIGLLDNTEAKVFNTVACFGARYNGYSREDSMLLTSIYNNGFLLYSGALIPVPMIELDIPEGVEVHEGSGSEHLMPIFCMEQYTGKPMGEAMMKAKLEYFNTFRHMERDDFSLATVMMFSLYGNPMIRMQRNEDVLEAARQQHVLPDLPLKSGWKNMPIRMKRTHRVWGTNSPSASLLEEIRGSVDSGLDVLHKGICQDLYEHLGLEPRWLDHIDSFEIPVENGRVEKGFIYSYYDKSRAYGNRAWVEVDPSGTIKRKYTTK